MKKRLLFPHGVHLMSLRSSRKIRSAASFGQVMFKNKEGLKKYQFRLILFYRLQR